MPFGLVEYVAILGEYMKDKVVRPELEGQKINPTGAQLWHRLR